MSTIVCRELSFGYDGSERNVFTGLNLVMDTAGGQRSSAGMVEARRPCCGSPRRAHAGPRKHRARRGHAAFPCMPSSPSVSAFEAARDAAGPFRRWETEMGRLLDVGDDDALERYGALQARFQEAGGYGIDAGISRELVALDVDPAVWRRPFQDLSGGERTRCLLAGLFARDEGFVLIDEPTNHLDLAGRAPSGLAEHQTRVVLVSHDRAFLDACIDQVVALNRDTVETQRTTFSVWREHFHQRLAAQRMRNAKLRKDVARLEASARHRRAAAMKRESDKTATPTRASSVPAPHAR